MKDIWIGNKLINGRSPSLIVAELSGNHLLDFETAIKTVYAMKDAGADCVKLQTVKPGSITLDCDKEDFIVKGTLWDGRKLFDLYSEVYTPWEWHEPLMKLAKDLGMMCFSSPFDFEAVDFLESLNVPAYKIASFEITDIPLIKYTAAKGKPILISTGIAEIDDIKDAVEACRSVGNNEIILLKCTSAYPTPLSEVNLNQITSLRSTFNVHVGLSDHTLGYLVPVGAAVLGACIIEKHFTLDRALGGPDSAFSLNPEEFKLMVESVRAIEEAKGSDEVKLTDKAKANRMFARSLYAVKDINEGEPITIENVKSIRPGFGMKPKYYESILGKTVNKFIERGTPIKIDDINV